MKKNIYEEYLELAGFEGKELQDILPDWIEGSKRLGLSEQDVTFAVREWIPKHWDIKYLGIRKMIGGFTREAIDIAKAGDYKKQGVKIVYGILPAILTSYQALKIAGGDKVFVSFPDVLLATFLNSFFHKLDPYLQAAEETGMTYGCRHCALNKTRIGSKVKNVIPSPDVIWSWGFNCDEGPKTDEYIQCLLSDDWNYVISRVPHDTAFGEIDNQLPDRVEYLAHQLKDGLEQIQKFTGIKVTDEHMNEAMKDSMRYMFKAATLGGLVAKADPQPLRGSAVTNITHPMSYPFNTGIGYMEEALDILTKEIRAEIKKGTGIFPKGAPKLGSYFVPFCIPWVDTIFMENGVAMTFSLTFTPSKIQMSPPAYKDPFMAAGEQWLKMPFGQNCRAEVDTMIEKVKANNPDGMLMGLFDFDRWLGAHQKMASKLVEEATGVPIFYMEADFWEDRDYSPEALRTRIESMCQVVKMKKASKS
jgi:benzoyl-CoA reductase/2-hydroxyglutaryl-CoA dehydratase subunit BcrC/BadD/HgdB